MWPPPNFLEFPSKEQILGIKGEIEFLKLELTDAQRRVEALEQSISDRSAWIAPIRMLPEEILSDIFMSACRNDWKLPLVLGFVCRKWRNILLDTPRAWTFISLFKYGGYTGNRSQLASIFIQRGRNSPLHVFADDYTTLERVGAQQHRIQCMCLKMEWEELCSIPRLEIVFSRLERLRILAGKWQDVSLIETVFGVGSWDMMCFPNLILLELSVFQPTLLRIAAAPKFPAIRQLTVICDDPSPLEEILMKCADSLESVNLTYRSSPLHQPGMKSKLHLPLLKHLRLAEQSTGDSPLWAFKASTPNLEAYFDDGNVSTLNVVEVDTRSVTHLDALIVPPFHLFPRLATLSLVDETKRQVDLMEAIRFLEDNPYTCTDLKVIEYTNGLSGGEPDKDYEPMQQGPGEKLSC